MIQNICKENIENVLVLYFDDKKRTFGAFPICVCVFYRKSIICHYIIVIYNFMASDLLE